MDALTVYATSGYLADAVANAAPDAEVTTMVGPGGDPHTYQPSTKDIETIQNADVVLWNGLHLEAQTRPRAHPRSAHRAGARRPAQDRHHW